MKYLLFIIYFSIFSCNSSAINCIKMDNIEWLDKNFDFSFTGRIESKQRDFSFTKEKYLVTVSVSNSDDISGKIYIWTPNSSDCGAAFELGKEYVIFAKNHKGKIFTYYDSSWVISEKTENLTSEYNEYYRKKTGSQR